MAGSAGIGVLRRRQVRRTRPVTAAFGVAILRATATLPYSLVYRVGGWLGALGSRLPLRPVRFADVTIGVCFPDLGAAERHRLLRRSLCESARTMTELGLIWTWSRDRLLGLVRSVEGEHHLRDALSQGRGIVLVTPHLGAWELAGLYGSLQFPMTVLYRQAGTSSLDRFMARSRARFGATLAPNSPGGVRQLARALARREAVGIMPDQEPRGGSGLFAPFFGVPAHTTTLVWRLARRSGAPVVLGFAERLAQARGFRMHFRPVPPQVHDPDPHVSVAALNLEIERLVREYPDQYLWSYKRFRVRPPGEANPYRPVTHVTTAAR